MLHILSNFIIKFNLHFQLTGDDKLPPKHEKFEDFMVILLHVLVNCNLLNKKLIKTYTNQTKKKFKTENYINFESQF